MNPLHLLIGAGAAALLLTKKKETEVPPDPRFSTDSMVKMPDVVQEAKAQGYVPSSEEKKKIMAAMIMSRMANRPPPDQFGCMATSSFSKEDAMAMVGNGWISTGSIQGGYGSLCPPGTDMSCDPSLTQIQMLSKPGCVVAAGMRSVTTAPKGM